jgi:CheY-like chemotaxis protein
VKQLVERHGGHVEARSDGPGAGSEFVVRLPTSATPIAQTSRNDAVRPGVRVEAKRVVVVDDQQDNADSLSMLLERMGHEPRVCYSGFQAVDLVAAFEPHVVLLDIGLPDVDGCEVARRIREQLPNANTLLVALTGRGEEKDRQRADEAGFDRYLLKPVDRDVLVALLDEPHGLAAPG